MPRSSSPKNVVLYADDDPDDLELVKEAFSRYSKNVEVITVMDGSQVLSYLHRLKEEDPSPCLVILDINMPMLNGKETLKKIREFPGLEKLPVVLFTTSSLPQDQVFARHYDAGFVTKPL